MKEQNREITEIERMAIDIDKLFYEAEIKQTLPKKHPSIVKAEALYNAGYRKQEWISVDERLPKANTECLVAAKVGNRIVVDTGERILVRDYRTMEHRYEWVITNDWDEGEDCEITHWMPLPEPPMKGGVE